MAQKARGEVAGIAGEFVGSKLGDTRRAPRLIQIAERIASAPGASFPTLFPDPSELEALYRFTGNDKIDWRDVCKPHVAATVSRCALQSVVRIAHDTTDFIFSGDREGMGPVMQKAKGFFLHAALAIAGDEERTPLGVVGLTPYIRTRERGMKTLNAWKREARSRPRQEKESSRWEKLAVEVSARLGTDVRAIHVMDQEADDFALLSTLTEAGLRFVVRGSSQRQVAGNLSGSLQDELNALQGQAFRQVMISQRTAKQTKGAKNRKAHPIREERLATLELRWGELRLGKPQHAQAIQPELRLAVVQVFEPDPPEGEEPIRWTLFTSEQVLSADDACAVVDHYRARWLIEEFFKALKTGCAFQERQLTTFAGLVRTLAILAPIAWHLLAVRSLGRLPQSPPATALFLPRQLIILAALFEDRVHRPFPEAPTVRDAMLAIAKIGGHIPKNGDPGWLTLGRGMQTFLDAQRHDALIQARKL